MTRRRPHPAPMSRETVDAISTSLPGAAWSDPSGGGHDAWTVGGKMVACIGMTGDGVSVKTPSVANARRLIEMGHATKAPCFHRSWVRMDRDAVPEEELRDRVETLCGLVLSGLTKTAQREITGE